MNTTKHQFYNNKCLQIIINWIATISGISWVTLTFTTCNSSKIKASLMIRPSSSRRKRIKDKDNRISSCPIHTKVWLEILISWKINIRSSNNKESNKCSNLSNSIDKWPNCNIMWSQSRGRSSSSPTPSWTLPGPLTRLS